MSDSGVRSTAHPRRGSIAFSGRHDSLAGAGCGELFDGAFYPIARAAALLRGYPVEVSGLRGQTVHVDAIYRVCMVLVQPDVRFRYPVEFLGILAVMHNFLI